MQAELSELLEMAEKWADAGGSYDRLRFTSVRDTLRMEMEQQRLALAAERARSERLEKALRWIADTAHAEECELFERKGGLCTCCQACRDNIDHARAALASEPTQEEK